MLTRNAQVVQSHAIKVWIDVLVVYPPLQMIVDILNRDFEVFEDLTCTRSSGN